MEINDIRVGHIVKFSRIAIEQQWWPIQRVTCKPEDIRGEIVAVTSHANVHVRWRGYKGHEVYPMQLAQKGFDLA